MTLKEAITSGKPFKRKHWDEWTIYNPEVHGGFFYFFNNYEPIVEIQEIGTSIDLYYEDILAEDWETK